jgi:hypothetical protein
VFEYNQYKSVFYSYSLGANSKEFRGFSYVFRYYVITFLVANWLLRVVAMLLMQRYDGINI